MAGFHVTEADLATPPGAHRCAHWLHTKQNAPGTC